MSSNIKHALPATLKALVVLLAVLLFFSAARAQMNDSDGGALGGGSRILPTARRPDRTSVRTAIHKMDR